MPPQTPEGVRQKSTGLCSPPRKPRDCCAASRTIRRQRSSTLSRPTLRVFLRPPRDHQAIAHTSSVAFNRALHAVELVHRASRASPTAPDPGFDLRSGIPDRTSCAVTAATSSMEDAPTGHDIGFIPAARAVPRSKCSACALSALPLLRPPLCNPASLCHGCSDGIAPSLSSQRDGRAPRVGFNTWGALRRPSYVY